MEKVAQRQQKVGGGMKLEIGGGTRPCGNGFRNLDKCPEADIVFDLDTIPPGHLPFADESVAECYSSHCFEHLRNPAEVMREVARVCRQGAPFELRVPHPLSDVAMVPGHLHVLSPLCLKNMNHYFRQDWWPPERFPRRLELQREEVSPSEFFPEIRGLHPTWSEEQVLKFAARAAHDVRFHFLVVANT